MCTTVYWGLQVILERTPRHAGAECFDQLSRARDEQGGMIPIIEDPILATEAQTVADSDQLAEQFATMREDEVSRAWTLIPSPGAKCSIAKAPATEKRLRSRAVIGGGSRFDRRTAAWPRRLIAHSRLRSSGQPCRSSPSRAEREPLGRCRSVESSPG